MGRHAGWIAAAGGLAGRKPGDPPHIILFPEIPFEQRAVSGERQAVRRPITATASSWCRRAPRYADGKFLADAGTKDAFGHTQLGGVGPVVANMVREAHGYKYPLGGGGLPAALRAPHRLQGRCRAGLRGRQGGGRAMRSKGMNAVMPAIERRSSKPYRWTIGPVPLGRSRQQREESAARTTSPRTASASRRPAAATSQPLIAGEEYPPYRDGLPDYVRIKGARCGASSRPTSSSDARACRSGQCARILRAAGRICYISRLFSAGRQVRPT